MASNAVGITGTVFNIQRFSLHDGTGIRTLVFMKGCPLRCRWCSNPEGFKSSLQIMEDIKKCIGCGACVKVCKQGAIKSEDAFQIDRKICVECGICAKYCPSNAKTVFGENKTVDEIIDIIKRDSPFYGESCGGVTIGGGEMLLQPAFVCEVLRRCREYGINTAIETSGYGSWEWLSKIAELCDIIHYDIKEIDPQRHMHFTGVDNFLILENLKNLNALLSAIRPMPRLILRLPLVEGYNLTEKYIEKTADYILSNLNNYNLVELLPFHNFGEQKYKKLGMPYELMGKPNANPEEISKCADILAKKGVSVKISQW